MAFYMCIFDKYTTTIVVQPTSTHIMEIHLSTLLNNYISPPKTNTLKSCKIAFVINMYL
jgi:hypothetical protein